MGSNVGLLQSILVGATCLRSLEVEPKLSPRFLIPSFHHIPLTPPILSRYKVHKIHFKKKNKMWYIHTVEYDSALKRKEILVPITVLMNLEDLMLNEIIWTQKEKYCMISFM